MSKITNQETESKIKVAQKAYEAAKQSQKPEDYIEAAKLLSECGFHFAAASCYALAETLIKPDSLGVEGKWKK